MLNKFSWSWPSFCNVAQPQTRWSQNWREAWRGAWSENWSSQSWSNPGIDLNGHGAASVRSLADPNGGDAFEFSELSERSVIALVGLAFEARIAAGPGVLVICRGRETPDLLQLAISAGCRSIISFGVAGGLAPDLVPGDCVVASAIIDYPALRPTDPLWSRKLADVIPGALHGPIVGVNSVVSDPADKCRLHALTGAVAVDMESHMVGRLAASHGLALLPCASSLIPRTGQCRLPPCWPWRPAAARMSARWCGRFCRGRHKSRCLCALSLMPLPRAPRSSGCGGHSGQVLAAN